jgi:hypothetical protein
MARESNPPHVALPEAIHLPDQKTSKRLLWRDLLFPLYNPTFGLLTGVLYLAIAWNYRAAVLQEFGTLKS